MPFPFQKLGKADEVWPPWSNLIWNVSGQHVGLCATSPEPGATTNPLAAFPGRSALSTRHTGIKRGNPWGSWEVAWPAPASQGKPVEQRKEMLAGEWEGGRQPGGRRGVRRLLEMLSMLQACAGDVDQSGADGRQVCLQRDEPPFRLWPPFTAGDTCCQCPA